MGVSPGNIHNSENDVRLTMFLQGNSVRIDFRRNLRGGERSRLKSGIASAGLCSGSDSRPPFMDRSSRRRAERDRLAVISGMVLGDPLTWRDLSRPVMGGMVWRRGSR